MIINIFVLKGDLNGKIVVVRFFFCRVYCDHCMGFFYPRVNSLQSIAGVTAFHIVAQISRLSLKGS